MEYITANGTQYECQNVSTSTNAITFTLANGDCEDVKATFSEVTEITVSDGTNIYGTYSNLVFESVTLYADDTIRVTMHIMSEEEIWKANMEASQAEQDDMIASLVFGEESEE